MTIDRSPDEPARNPHGMLLAARAGDRASMQAIYEAEGPRLFGRLRHLTGDPAWAQDLTHDAFVIAFSGRAPFDGGSAPGTWLYGVALNLWRNDRRKAQRRAKMLAARPEPATRTTADDVTSGELERRLALALAELPERLREAFVLRAIEQLPLREAAELAGVSESTMSKRASQAEARVRAALDGAPPNTKESRRCAMNEP